MHHFKYYIIKSYTQVVYLVLVWISDFYDYNIKNAMKCNGNNFELFSFSSIYCLIH